MGTMGLADLLLLLARPAHACACAGAYLAWRVAYALWLSPLRNVPGPFWARISKLPMFLHDVRGTEREFMLQNCARYGSVFVMEPAKVAVCDPDDCLTVLGSHAFAKDALYDRVDFLEPNVFLTRDPALNRHRRRQIGPALGLHSLLRMEPAILAAGPRQLLAKWDRAVAASADGRARVCYYYDFSLMTFDVISSLGFGRAHRSLTTGDRRIVEWVRQSFTLMFLQIVVPVVKWPPLRRLLAGPLYRGVDEFIAFGARAIDDRRRTVRDGPRPSDMLQSFIDAEDPESRVRMTPAQVTTETIITLLAGADTSSNTLCWTLHLLLLHPPLLARAVREVRAAFAAGHVIAFEEARARLPFLEACVYESMRLRPVSGNLPRCIPRGGVVLQRHFIPEGHTCSVSIAAANTNPAVWAKPLVFWPDRFLANEPARRRMLTFSAGVRACPGRHLAWIEIVTTLANVLSAFDLALPDDALFTPRTLDAAGQPETMPHFSAITCSPKFPDRDCVVMVSRRRDAASLN
ncbi:hypothetical protein H4R18_001247 [Coemansia javaensis]|uniref:Cytochrome P450 n=1 Tax=Coemansia javaensis TaxID=2761396 RepID=A0A9W8HKD2_9FUNG|nr:hypothetical protein H4R18_001247 [Coemansia javaensis]